jgi:hypothetical protein
MGLPTKDGQPADLELGQPDFTAAQPNRGGAPGAATLSFPAAALIEGDALFVADSGNNRVLRWQALPATSGTSADAVLGQLDFANRLAGSDPTDLVRLAGPVALASDGARLYVADRDLGRVVAFDLPAAGGAASLALGATTAIRFSSPSGLAVERTPRFTSQLYVASTLDDSVDLVAPVSRLRLP